MTLASATIEAIEQADATLESRCGVPRTLEPNGTRATRLATLVDRLGPSAGSALESFALGLAAIVQAQVENFPDTIFWDIDCMATCLATGPAADDPDAMRRLCGEIVELQRQYGRHSILAFRYTHDFTYGFDWAKWVGRAPRERAEIGPFHPTFIAYLRRRGDELVELIANDDEKYPKLPDGTPRNPFGFRREPDDETALFVALARNDLLPLRGWDATCVPRCDRPFADLRESQAHELGIPTKQAGGA